MCSGQWSVRLTEEGLQEERKVEVRRGVREEGGERRERERLSTGCPGAWPTWDRVFTSDRHHPEAMLFGALIQCRAC